MSVEAGLSRAIFEAELVACRRHAQHELDRWLGGPTREYHLQADTCLDVIDWSDFWLGELERWRTSA